MQPQLLKVENISKTANGGEYKVLSKRNINTLRKDTTSISESKDLKEQRMNFANLSIRCSSHQSSKAYHRADLLYILPNEKSVPAK